MSHNVSGRLSRVVADASILMIDDEPLNMKVLQIHLEGVGYSHFTSISDSTQALEALETHLPDVVLLDIMMPNVSGFDILEEMARRPSLTGIPVIVLTSSDDAETKLQALELGASDFLAKPLDPSELALRMRNTLVARSWQLRSTHVDALTELPNQVCLTSLLDREFSKGEAPTDCVLICIDLNGFKGVNLSFGVKAGDTVLWAMRERLIASFGRNDPSLMEALSLHDEYPNCVARLGADRFAVVMTGLDPVTLETTVTRQVSRFLSMLEKPVAFDEKSIHVTASVGIARLAQDGIDTLSLLSVAETAMGYARDRGENAYAFYAYEMDARARQRMSLEQGLRTAIEEGEIFVTYQPKISVQSGTISGAEALIRWNHPTRGLISPVEFIPLAEESGQIISIGRWVMLESCRQTKAWLGSDTQHFRIAVNVSIRQLQQPDFVDTVQQVLLESGLPADKLIVELTENMLMENAEINVGKLQQLRELGVSLSIDDFGTGYSSLAYLQRFPVDQLKIDRSFIGEIKNADSEVPIVKAIISLAHDLNLEVVAEGVETQEQLQRLQSLRAEEFQGFLASRPIVAEEFAGLLMRSMTKVRKAA